MTGDGRWIALEHELWTYAARNPQARAHLVGPVRGGVGRHRIGAEWVGGEAGGPGTGPALIGLLLGLEMMRRVSPDAVPDELAVAALRGVVTASTKEVHL